MPVAPGYGWSRPSSPRTCASTTTSTPRPTGSTPSCWPGCRCCTPTGSGLVPKIDQSGTAERHHGLTKAGDHVLRYSLFFTADHARKTDPTLAERYQRMRDRGKHHNSALCTLAAVLITRIAA